MRALFPRSRIHGLLLGLFLAISAALPADSLASAASSPLPLYEVDLTAPGARERFATLDQDRLPLPGGKRALVLGWPGTRRRLEEAGFPVRVLSEDYGAERARRAGVLRAAEQGGVPPMGEGSLAGFWTLEEVYALLDSLASTDTLGIVTDLDTLGYSVQGRPILALGVASEEQPLGTRPEVLLTGLTHAREPEGMQVVLYFLLRLVEDYGSDPEITYLVDEREIWFVPVVNPDGYFRNETTWNETGSFGYWRKNLRDNDQDSTITDADGVDLNRNFGFQWGYDDQGSSPDPSSSTYRGPAPFSEPETQALRDFCLAHAFVTAENYHTYYEACLYPWSYAPEDAPDSSFFFTLSDAMMQTPRYAYGRAVQILHYSANGDANDWMYGETAAKPRIFALTTEVGDHNDGFWPEASRIVPLAEANFPANQVLAYAAGVYLVADSLSVSNPAGALHVGETAGMTVRLRHLGAQGTSSGGITVTVASGDGAVTVTSAQASYRNLGPGEAAWPEPGERFVLHASASAVPGTVVPLLLSISDGSGYAGRDTVWFRLGEPTVLFADAGDRGLDNWFATGGWGLEAVDGDSAFSDSPGARYVPDADARLTLRSGLDLTGMLHAVVRFRTQWEIEGGYDFARVEASADSGASWTALPGRATRPGHGTAGYYAGGTQPEGVPGYDGTRRFWLEEEVDLSDYAGMADVRLRFRLTSDSGLEQDGWLVDDITVLGYGPEEAVAVSEPAGIEPPARIVSVAPNPFRAGTRIAFTPGEGVFYRLAVYDVAGRQVRVLQEGPAGGGTRSASWDGRLAGGTRAPAGAYYLRLVTPRRTQSVPLLLLP